MLAAHADATAGDQDVRAGERVLHGGQHRLGVVAHDRIALRVIAGFAGCGGEHRSVGFPDLAGNQACARLDKLVASRNYRDARSGPSKNDAVASRPRCTAPSLVPFVSRRSPGTASPPTLRTEAPVATLPRIATRSVPPSVSSTWTTASAPDGIAAPVMIRMQDPGTRSWRPVSPAAISPVTGSTTGLSSLAAATSLARTA